MRSVVYRRFGGPEVLTTTERAVAEPGLGDVRVRVELAGINPTDCKSIRGDYRGSTIGESGSIPGQDGVGVVDAVGIDASHCLGDRVWLWEVAWGRSEGTVQEFVVVPSSHAVVLPASVGSEVGASLGVPALTAHRCLSAAARLARLEPGSLDRKTVLVAAANGQVGHFVIQLARWAGASVIGAVRDPARVGLASRAGAGDVVWGAGEQLADAIRTVARRGVDIVVDPAPARHTHLYSRVLASNGSIAVYSDLGGESFELAVGPLLARNAQLHFVGIYGVDSVAKSQAVDDVSRAAADGGLSVGVEHGLPVHRFGLDQAIEAHRAVSSGRGGKVLIEVADRTGADDRHGRIDH